MVCQALGNLDYDVLNSPDTFPEVQYIIVAQHGANYDPRKYLRILKQAASVASKYDNTLIVAPFFAYDKGVKAALKQLGRKDDPAAPFLYWDKSNTKGWSGGGDNTNKGGIKNISAYEIMDALLVEFSNCTKFPNLQRISLAGHSQGGAFVDRYVAYSSVFDQMNYQGYYTVQALPAGLSYYIYYDDMRVKDPSSTQNMQFLKANQSSEIRRCSGFNRWPFGPVMTGAPRVMKALMRGQPREFMQVRHWNKTVTYLVGDEDRKTISRTKNVCADYLQGTHRVLKHQLYYGYILAPGMYFQGISYDHILYFDSLAFYRQPGFEHDGEQLWTDLCVEQLYGNRRIRRQTQSCQAAPIRKYDTSHLPKGLRVVPTYVPTLKRRISVRRSLFTGPSHWDDL